MGSVQALHHVNGGDSAQTIECAFCHSYLGETRAVANTIKGVRFFCKMGRDDKPEDSCFLQWQRRQH